MEDFMRTNDMARQELDLVAVIPWSDKPARGAS